MAQYDSSIVHTFADKLYQQAASIVVSMTLLFGVLGSAIGGSMAQTVNDLREAALVAVGAGALLGALIGYSVGSARAFVLKLQAQTALCQVQIEMNTRAAAAAARVALHV